MAEGDRWSPDVVRGGQHRAGRGTVYRSAAAGRFGAPGVPPDELGAAAAVSGVDEVGAAAPIDDHAGGGAEPATTGPGTRDDSGGGAAGHSAVMALGSLVSRGTGFLRTVAIGAAVGALGVGNAYTTAQLFPGMIYELLLGGILTSVVVPVLVRRRKAEPDRGEAYTQRLLSLAVIALAIAALLAVLAAPLLAMVYANTDDSAFRSLVTAFSYLILPTIFFYGLAALLGAVLNTRGHFAAPTWTPILNNLVVIATAGLYIVLFGAKEIRPEDMTPARVLVLGGGTLLGIAIQSAGLWPALRRVGFRWKWRFDFGALGLRELGRLGGWMFCYVAVSQIGVLVLLNLLNRASETGPGGKAGVLIYNNVYLLLMMAHGIIAVSIIVALMPRMSAAAADGRYADLTADLSRGTRMTTVVLAPIAVGYAVLAAPIAVTLFRWGAFSNRSAAATTLVLLMAALALVPFAISQLFTFAFYALPDTRTPALINIPIVGLRVAIQIGLFFALAAEFTAAGLMIGNGVSFVAATVISAWLLRGRVGRIGLREISVTFGKVLVASLGSALVGYLAVSLLPGDGTPTKLEAIVRLVVGGGAIVVGYLGLARVLRIGEINDVLALVRRKLGR
jgi:putative peptidoglycan lipid II flippase